jgi:hypothetical protein
MTNAERPEWNGGKTLNPLNRETFRLCPDATARQVNRLKRSSVLDSRISNYG